jgi:hypothetical protein
VTLLNDQGLRSNLLEVARQAHSAALRPRDTAATGGADPGTRSAESEPGGMQSPDGLLPLPAPSADGVILLNERGPYAAANIPVAGHLIIRGAIGVNAEIQVDKAPLKLVAQSVTLERVTVSHLQDDNLFVMVLVHSQQLEVINCHLRGFLPPQDATEDTSTGRGTAAIAWMPRDLRDPQAGKLAIKDSIFQGRGAAILSAQTPRTLHVSNTLKTGRGAFLSLGPKSLATGLKLEFDHVTLRASGPLLCLAGEHATKSGSPAVRILAQESVFSIAEIQSGLIVVEAERPRADVAKSIEMIAPDSVITPGTALLSTLDAARNHVSIQEADDHFDGLVASGIEFSGPGLQQPAEAKTARLQGPRTANKSMPGIEPRHLGPMAR